MAAAGVTADDFDEELLICPNCMDLYEDPRILPCLHTFCGTCLETLASNSGGRKFQCPKCSSDVELTCPIQEGGVIRFKNNFHINKLLDFKKLKQCTSSPVQCQLCMLGEAIAVCGDCKFLCNNCVTVHEKTPGTKDHVTVTFNDLENPTKRSEYERQINCPKHNQRMILYCETCTTLACIDCTYNEHRQWNWIIHDLHDLDTVAPKHQAITNDLMTKTKAVVCKLNQEVEDLDRELTATEEIYEQVETEIQQHFATLRSKLEEEEKQMITKVRTIKKCRADYLTRQKEETERELKKTNEGLVFCQNILDRDDSTEYLYLMQQMDGKLRKLAAQQTSNKTFQGRRTVTFEHSSLSQVSGGSLSVSPGFEIYVEGQAVESWPCSVTVTHDPADSMTGDIAPQIEVTSPQGKSTLIHTTAHTCTPTATGKGQTSTVSRAWDAVWRPQISGKHILSVCMGDKKDLGSLSVHVDVGSNSPVLRFGQKGSRQGQFKFPVDVAVRGDRLYVADTWMKRVQVFDLSGNFDYLFKTSTNPCSLAVQADGTIVVKCEKEVKKFSQSGELLYKFPVGEYCSFPYGLAVQRDGRVVVADSDKHSIFLFEADGTLVKHVGGEGQGEGQFNDPSFVCVDKEDNIIVSDKENDSVQVFDKNLNFKHKFGQGGKESQDMWGPMGVSVDSRGNIVLANTGKDSDTTTTDGGGIEHGRKLQVFRSDGTWVSTISSDGDKLNTPYGVAVTEDGHVFVSSPSDHCIRKYRYM